MKLITLISLTFLVHMPSALALEWADLWFTPDQQGQRLMDQGEYQRAAGKYTTLERIGVALFQAGDFERSASVLGRSASPEAHYNRGNAHIMLGDYDAAIEAYQSAGSIGAVRGSSGWRGPATGSISDIPFSGSFPDAFGDGGSSFAHGTIAEGCSAATTSTSSFGP